MNETADIAVIGGGAIGCSIAYHAAARGARVTLLEAEELGSGSSGALAGMLSGQGEREKPGPLRDLLIQGRVPQDLRKRPLRGDRTRPGIRLGRSFEDRHRRGLKGEAPRGILLA